MYPIQTSAYLQWLRTTQKHAEGSLALDRGGSLASKYPPLPTQRMSYVDAPGVQLREMNDSFISEGKIYLVSIQICVECLYDH